MAQPIAPELWQEGIEDNRLLPGRLTNSMFTGNGVKIANNAGACRVWDINVSDYITDYDDRRINGHANVANASNFNADGRDGWGASAWGVFQDVRFTSRVYTMGRHRSTALRVYDEQQYSGAIGEWGDATTSKIITPGQSLMKTAAMISKAKQIWSDEVLDPDIDKYNLFAVLQGHISGRCVGKDTADNDKIFSGDAEDYEWIAQPGMMEGSAIPPRFAPIHGIQWDDQNVTQMLQNIKVTWNNLRLPQENRVIYLDPFYEIELMHALTGSGLPATEAAYNDVKNGSFARLMGWDFDFSIPGDYWPSMYFDDNLNVVHGKFSSGSWSGLASDNSINSIAGAGKPKLLQQLIAADRMSQLNFVRTTWDKTNKVFTKTLTNYPLGEPWADGYYDQVAVQVATGSNVDTAYGQPTAYPFAGPGSGYGLKPYESSHAGEAAYATGPIGTPTKKKVIGLALYRPAAQLSQEYSEMRTEDGGTRGKFTEMVFDVKYDAWVIERLACGILPILEGDDSTVSYGIPVSVVDPVGTYDAPIPVADVTVADDSSTHVLTATVVYKSTTAPTSPSLTYAWQDAATGATVGSNQATLAANDQTAGHKYICTVTASGTATGKATSDAIASSVTASE